jgi:two-component system chemotaxis sensor kinase CheA
MDDLLADFLTETTESLAELDLALVKLEQEPEDAATLSKIFRLVHTIKGTCGFLGLPRLERVAHAGENVLGKVRDGALSVTPDVVSIVLAALDRIKVIVGALAASGSEPAGNDADLIAALDAVHNGTAVPAAAAGAPATATTAAAAPAAAAPQPAKAPAAEVEPPPPAPPPPPAEAPVAEPVAASDGNLAAQTIRVGVDVLENLMTLVSELVLTRNQLLQLARSQENAGFTGPLQRLSHITSDLQEGIMKTRMQPIGYAWNKLPRIVRDLARELEKKIDLVMLGADTELDRQVLELIKDPLTHMVRNSGDHGLEGPAARRAAGKSETGRITLNAFHEGGHIVIEISDDGRGLPIDRIRAKVLAQGLSTEAELAAMSPEAIQRFIFRAGFSTAAAVTAVSGRGVGMDVVKTNIERIGGTIDLKSVAGQGTVFTIKIPLTLAIVAALIVEAGGERFAIPQISVVELVRAQEGTGQAAAAAQDQPADSSASTIERINGTPVLRLRERLLPLVKLDDLLQLHGRPSPASQGRASETGVDHGRHDGSHTIIVAQVGASLLGLVVDRVFDTEEIVVKPVAPVLRHISMFSGNTILGDGSVIMILDPSGIARATGIAGSGDGRLLDPRSSAQAAGADSTDTTTAMLLFRAGDASHKAVPLGLVARLENIPRERIEFAAGVPVTQYRGRLMRLVSMSGEMDSSQPEQPVLVFTDSDTQSGLENCMGLAVDQIVDVVDEHLRIELSGARDGILGTAVIAGNATDVIDTSYWLTRANQDWFSRAGERDRPNRPRLLMVEDSDFFRQMIVPVLQAAGYEVSAVATAAKALQLRESGRMFDVIISDIEMPDMDGLAFVRAVRASGAWAELPVIALAGRVSEQDVEDGRDAGFTDYVGKSAREALLRSLRQCLAHPPGADDPMRMVA